MQTSRATLFLLLLACVFAAGQAAAQPAVPPLTGRVVDRAEILGPATEQQLADLLAAHEDSTTNQVAVLTVPSLEGAPIEDYALDVARTWGLGTSANDNGVLLLIAKDDRELRIEVGDGLQGTLPDVTADRIIRNEIVPRFRNGDFEGGVRAGVGAILAAIAGEYEVAEAGTYDGSSGDPPLLLRLLMGGFFLLLSSLFASMGVLGPGCVRWFMFFFLIPFFAAVGAIITDSARGGLIVVFLYTLAYLWASRHPQVQQARRKIKTAQKSGEHEKFRLGPFTMSTSSFQSSGSSGGGFSGGSSFSGGGGSFSGGGASGSW